MAGEVSFTRSEADFADAQREWWRRAVGRRGMLVRCAALALVSFLYGALILGADDSRLVAKLAYGAAGIVFFALVMAVCLGVSYALLPRRSRKIFRQTAGYGRPLTMRWSDIEYGEESANGTAHFAWEDFHTWRPGRKATLLYHNDGLFRYVPNRVLTDEQLADLRCTIEQRGLRRS